MWAYVKRQIGLESYYPGTPAPPSASVDLFPYHIWGTGKDPNVLKRQHAEGEEERKQEAIRRRLQPSCIEEACVYGNLQAAVLFCAQGLDVTTRRTTYEGSDASPLMWAAFKGHLPIVRFLVDQGAPLETTNVFGHTALHWAISSGRPEIAAFLLECGADPAHADRQGFDASFTAVQQSQMAILVMLTERQQPGSRRKPFTLDPHRRDVQGHSLLHWAAYRNSTAIVEYLAAYGGFDLNVRDAQGRTPMLWAAREGYAEVIECLLAYGADRSIPDQDGLTPLQYCTLRNHHEARHVLLAYPASADGAAASSTVEAVPMSLDVDKGAAVGEHSRDVTLRTPVSTRQYRCVRDRRRLGTCAMMLSDRFFAFMAVVGFLYTLACYPIMFVITPLASHFLYGITFFKNLLWTLLRGSPVQGAGTDDTALNAAIQGIAHSMNEAFRGIVAHRFRDATTLVVVVTCLLVQQHCWTRLGLSPILYSLSAEPTLEGDVLRSVIPSQREERWRRKQGDFNAYFLGSVLSPLFSSADAMIGSVLCALLVATLTCLVLCKVLAPRSMVKVSEEGTWRNSPLWRIVASRQFRFLHPRTYLQERHTQQPLRSFYCIERDCIVRRYDGYSSLMDCPIGESNHLPFVLFFTFASLQQLLMVVWGYQQLAVLMDSSYYAPWYLNAFFPLQSFDDLAKSPSPRPYTPTTESPSVVSFAWINCFLQLAIHGLPGPLYQHLYAITSEYVAAQSDSTLSFANRPWRLLADKLLRRLEYVFRYYWLPTSSNACGAWVFHLAAYLLVLLLPLAVRQWLGVWSGATRLEIANPLAPSEDGRLVSIFPPTKRRATPCEVDVEEEAYYARAAPSKVQSLDNFNGDCIYADGSGPYNALMFLLGRQGRRWRGADVVSSTNTPATKKL